MFEGVEMPVEVWELEVLAARVKGFVAGMLDEVLATGQWVWVGGEGGVVSFWRRGIVGGRSATPQSVGEDGLRDRCRGKVGVVLDFLRERGASFLLDLELGLKMEDWEVAEALLELVWAGIVSHDRLEGLREVERLAERGTVQGRQDVGRYPFGQRVERRRLRVGKGSFVGGRWFVLPSGEGGEPTPSETAGFVVGRVERFLRRTGFACRELVEGVDGSWRECYQVLSRMEWAGRVKRGYFVEGVGGSQFLVPGVRWPAPTESAGFGGVVWLSMVDPGNLWARVEGRVKIARVVGNWVGLVDGRAVVGVAGSRLVPLVEGSEKYLTALPELLGRTRRKYIEVRWWGEEEVIGSVAEAVLRGVGFARDTQGLRLYRQY